MDRPPDSRNRARPMDHRRSILVTGASSGIGAYCAAALAKEGWRVFATARKPEDLARLEAGGLDALYMDYTEPASIEALVPVVLERTGGRLDALYNNGGYAQTGAVEDLPTAALKAQFETNLFGWHELTRRIVPVMRAQGGGRIVNCSSILGIAPVKFRGAYAASKHALEAMTLCLRAELEGTGIKVSLIEPGPIRSKMPDNALPYFRDNIDLEGSPHRKAYEAQLARLSGGGTRSRLKLGPDAVYAALKSALEAENPRPHYFVTTPAKVGALLKRMLPPSLYYKVLASRA